MTTLVGISGSLRAGSYNTALLRAAQGLVPEGTRLDAASIADIPLYDGDLEARGVPEAVARVKEQVASADGLLLVTPEYNGSIPGVMKNAIDWMSRPPRDIARVFGDKPVALIGATPGRAGTRLAQAAWLPVFRQLGMRPWYGAQLAVSGAKDVFGPDGALVDPTIEKLLRELVEGFARYCASQR